jgi:magnesium-transporting ATPase (P-type)
MTKYYGITQFISVVVTLICTTDVTYLTSLMITYKSLFITLMITLFLSMSKPAKKLTKYLNNSNFLDLEHHFVYWVTTIIYTIGLLVAYLYYM